LLKKGRRKERVVQFYLTLKLKLKRWKKWRKNNNENDMSRYKIESTIIDLSRVYNATSLNFIATIVKEDISIFFLGSYCVTY